MLCERLLRRPHQQLTGRRYLGAVSYSDGASEIGQTLISIRLSPLDQERPWLIHAA